MPHKGNYIPTAQPKPVGPRKPPKGGNIGKALRDRNELFNKAIGTRGQGK